MDGITITRESKGTRGRYVAQVEGSSEQAELNFRRLDPDIVDAYHTGTPDALRGRGIATALVERLVADARRDGLRIRPTCPFVAAQFDRHPDWTDLRA